MLSTFQFLVLRLLMRIFFNTSNGLSKEDQILLEDVKRELNHGRL